MALADIISRIASDAEEEALRIVSAAERRAEEITGDAQRRAEEHSGSTLAAARRDAEREASRIVVTSRLEGRDVGLAARRTLVEEALTGAGQALAQLDESTYVLFLAERIAAVVSGGETLRFGAAEAPRAEQIVAAVASIAPGVALTRSEESAPFERGALVEGDRVRSDLSLETIVEERRDELELTISSSLFAEGA